VIVCLGGNDMLRPGSDMLRLAELTERAIQRCLEAGVRMVLLSGGDPSERLPLGSMMRRKGEALTQSAIDLAKRYDITFVDVFHDVEIRRAGYWSHDRLHLNAAGHRRVAGLVLTALGHSTEAHVIDPGPEEPRKVLTEANYDLLAFMYTSVQRAQQIARNRALMMGDGVNEPLGWMTADCFTHVKTPTTSFNHVDFRIFYASAPLEYGPVTAVMHPNMFSYLSALTDSNGRFIFGDGLMTYSPADVRENIRISSCLPDPTHGLTLGSATAPFITGEFLLAIGAWSAAYYQVQKRPLWIEQWEGQSTAWCVKYVFGAEDGGFTACCPAARIITVGP